MKFRFYMDVEIPERGIKRAYRLQLIQDALRAATEDVIREMRVQTEGISMKKLDEDEQ